MVKKPWNSPDHYFPPRWFPKFRIKHYAGSVTYSVEGFVAKNSDLLERDLSAVMFQSEHPLLKTLFPEGNMKRSMRRRPATVATQFKISIGALINNLASKSAHFVRCIKPNENRLSRCPPQYELSYRHILSGCSIWLLFSIKSDTLGKKSAKLNFSFRNLANCSWKEWMSMCPPWLQFLQSFSLQGDISPISGW